MGFPSFKNYIRSKIVSKKNIKFLYVLKLGMLFWRMNLFYPTMKKLVDISIKVKKTIFFSKLIYEKG